MAHRHGTQASVSERTFFVAKMGRIGQIGIIVASILDAYTTYRMLATGQATEVNPAGIWMHAHLGLTVAALIRILGGCAVALLAARLCRYNARRGRLNHLTVWCWASVTFATVWGLVALHNLMILRSIS